MVEYGISVLISMLYIYVRLKCYFSIFVLLLLRRGMLVEVYICKYTYIVEVNQ